MDIERLQSEEEYVAQMKTGALLNPRVDSTFKALFTQPTEESHDALHSFLEAATERKIESFSLTANEAPTGFDGQRGVSYDIMCVFDDGLSADIEMQAFSREYDYGKRAEYQVARLETTYLKKGDDWEKAPIVYQVTVLDFNYGNSREESDTSPVSRYAMRTKDGRELSNSLNIVFVELPKTGKLEATLDTNTPLENWAIFLKEADNPKKRDIINRLVRKEAGLMQAQKSLSSISSNMDLWIAQYRQEIADRDRMSSINAALKKGKREGKYEDARNFLKLGIPAEKVAAGTGLPLAEIKALIEDN
ncbi:MAG: Rpn family recombination-promoting nuclease/putative transposase [Treponema sp.]|nr:Rpn family recombination-promoting nuclease/putative transposase [Treponema sp.]